MKRNVMWAGFLSLFVFTFAAAAQDKAANFTGTWTLAVSKSQLDERSRVESQTLTVMQTDKDIKIETATKRASRPADAQDGERSGGGRPRGERMGGGRMGGGFGGGDGTTTYTLDGKETKTEVTTQRGSMPVSLKAKIESGKLNLSRTSTFDGPNGEISMTTKETWELSKDGGTLTVNTERNSPRGTNSTTMVYTKKQ